MNVDTLLENLERFGISTTSHSQESLLSHLKGTWSILNHWNCEEATSLAGLCHSIYGTESFLKVSATLDNREYLQSLIGIEAENLAYLFGAHKKDSLWENLNRSGNFSIHDRFVNQSRVISKKELSDLITITLANWLEQRPRCRPEDQFIRQKEFTAAKELLPALAYQEFLTAYGL